MNGTEPQVEVSERTSKGEAVRSEAALESCTRDAQRAVGQRKAERAGRRNLERREQLRAHGLEAKLCGEHGVEHGHTQHSLHEERLRHIVGEIDFGALERHGPGRGQQVSRRCARGSKRRAIVFGSPVGSRTAAETGRPDNNVSERESKPPDSREGAVRKHEERATRRPDELRLRFDGEILEGDGHARRPDFAGREGNGRRWQEAERPVAPDADDKIDLKGGHVLCRIERAEDSGCEPQGEMEPSQLHPLVQGIVDDLDYGTSARARPHRQSHHGQTGWQELHVLRRRQFKTNVGAVDGLEERVPVDSPAARIQAAQQGQRVGLPGRVADQCGEQFDQGDGGLPGDSTHGSSIGLLGSKRVSWER